MSLREIVTAHKLQALAQVYEICAEPSENGEQITEPIENGVQQEDDDVQQQDDDAQQQVNGPWERSLARIG